MDRQGLLALGRALLILGSAAQIGCGSGGNGLDLGPTNVVVYQREFAFEELPRFGVFVADFEAPETGDLQVTVDWSLASDDIDLVLSNPACDEVARAAGTCKVLASDGSNAKPAELRLSTTATAYRLFVVNLGPGSESGSALVTLTQPRLVP
jgi:hypothetical protein